MTIVPGDLVKAHVDAGGFRFVWGDSCAVSFAEKEVGRLRDTEVAMVITTHLGQAFIVWNGGLGWVHSNLLVRT